MKREIKFRAWDKHNLVMCNVLAINWDENLLFFECHIGTDNYISDWWTIESFDLLRYTGLKDKNGKEIYEGDIVKWEAGSHWNNCGGETKEARTEKVYYEGFGFEPFIHSLGYSDVTMIDYSDCEVIGNIYEHPELINE